MAELLDLVGIAGEDLGGDAALSGAATEETDVPISSQQEANYYNVATNSSGTRFYDGNGVEVPPSELGEDPTPVVTLSSQEMDIGTGLGNNSSVLTPTNAAIGTAVVTGVVVGSVCGTQSCAISSSVPSATNFSLGGSDLKEILRQLKPVLKQQLPVIASKTSDNVLLHSAAVFAQGKTFSNKVELDALVKAIVEDIVRILTIDPVVTFGDKIASAFDAAGQATGQAVLDAGYGIFLDVAMNAG